jgi:hypothetical protein
VRSGLEVREEAGQKYPFAKRKYHHLMGKSTLLALLIALLGALPARADYEETERRLKTTGIDPAQRKRIHDAIDRGVEFLLSRQAKKGLWPMREMGTYTPAGIAALCTLALRHAGTARAMVGFEKGMAYLFPDDGAGLAQIHDYIYTAGITIMIVMADRSRVEVGQEIARQIARSHEPKSGWWGYFLVRTEAPTPGANPDPGRAWRRRNLSTTQFAALGLWAGDRLGARIEKRVWQTHLEALIRYQTSDGSWPYDPLRGVAYGSEIPPGKVVRKAGEGPDGGFRSHTGYPTGTCMGLANLLLAKRALRRVLKQNAALAAQAKVAQWKGLDALHRDGPAMLKTLRERGWVDLDTYYSLYSLEKACIFADLTTVGGVPWYRVGAAWLCDTQQADGRWGDVAVDPQQGGFGTAPDIDTAFALLFLLRASETYTPVSPRPPDSGEITPRPGEPEKKPRAPLPDAPPPGERIDVDISLARLILARHRLQIEENSGTNEELETSLSRINTAYHGLVPNDGQTDDEAFAAAASAWRTAAHQLALAAVTLEKVEFGARENGRRSVNLLAARLLGGWSPAVSPGLVEAFARGIFRVRRYRVDPALYEIGFTSLAALNRPQAFVWLAEDVVCGERTPDKVARIRHALHAMRIFESVPGTTRFAAVKRIRKKYKVIMLSGAETHARLVGQVGGPLIETLRHLSRDPRTGRAPTHGSLDVRTFQSFEAWLKAHSNPDRPPWR